MLSLLVRVGLQIQVRSTQLIPALPMLA